MISKKLKIVNEQGMHMRPASLLSQMATPYESSIKVVFNGKEYDCKSIMFLMSACIKYNSEIELVCDGPDEEKALEELAGFIESGLGD